MSDKYLILLLQIIHGNNDITPLLNYGLNYSQIAEYLNYALKKRYISKKDNVFKITKIGEKKLISLNKNLNRFNSERWISPYDQYKIDKIGFGDIYIPRMRKGKKF